MDELSEETTVNEKMQIEKDIDDLQDIVKKDNAYHTIYRQFSDMVTYVGYVVTKQNSEWGYCSANIVNDDRPQDYVMVEFTGYETQHKLSFNVDVIHANQIVESEMKEFEIDPNNFKESVRTCVNEAHIAFDGYLKESVTKLDTNLDYSFTTYSEFADTKLQDHRDKLVEAGYGIFPETPGMAMSLSEWETEMDSMEPMQNELDMEEDRELEEQEFELA